MNYLIKDNLIVSLTKIKESNIIDWEVLHLYSKYWHIKIIGI